MMRRTREQMRAVMEAEASAVIEGLLNWHEESMAPDLSQIEERMLKWRQRLGQGLAEVVLRDQEVGQPADLLRCPTCGEVVRYKGQKRLVVESRLGPLTLERGYYHCACCGSGFFPPG